MQLLKATVIVKGDLTGKGISQHCDLTKNDLKLKLCMNVLTLILINDKTQYQKHTRYANWKESFACVVIYPTYTLCKRLRKFRIGRHVLRKDGSPKKHSCRQTPMKCCLGICISRLSLHPTGSLGSSRGRSDQAHVLQGPAAEPLMTPSD